MVLRLPERLLDELSAEAKRALPWECCGALLGSARPGVTRIVRLVPLANVSDTPEHRYEIDPRELLELHLRQAQSATDVVGFYHSHPRGEARPSEVDRRAAWPELSYLICSVAGSLPVARSWRLSDDRFVEEHLAVEDPTGRESPHRAVG